MESAQVPHGAAIANLLRGRNKASVLIRMMRKHPQMIGEVGSLLASDEFFRYFAESDRAQKQTIFANMTDLLAAAHVTFRKDEQYDLEIRQPIRIIYVAEFGRKSTGKETKSAEKEK
jgi:hypothetical protein